MIKKRTKGKVRPKISTLLNEVGKTRDSLREIELRLADKVSKTEFTKNVEDLGNQLQEIGAKLVHLADKDEIERLTVKISTFESVLEESRKELDSRINELRNLQTKHEGNIAGIQNTLGQLVPKPEFEERITTLVTEVKNLIRNIEGLATKEELRQLSLRLDNFEKQLGDLASRSDVEALREAGEEVKASLAQYLLKEEFQGKMEKTKADLALKTELQPLTVMIRELESKQALSLPKADAQKTIEELREAMGDLHRKLSNTAQKSEVQTITERLRNVERRMAELVLKHELDKVATEMRSKAESVEKLVSEFDLPKLRTDLTKLTEEAQVTKERIERLEKARIPEGQLSRTVEE